MRKMIVFFIILSLLGFASFQNDYFVFERIAITYNSTYYFYCYSTNEKLSNYEIKNGMNGCIIKMGTNVARKAKKYLKNVLGESFTFCEQRNAVEKIIKQLDATVLQIEDLGEDFVSIYLYSSKENLRQIKVNDQIVNLQIVYNKGQITVGTPIILGSY